MTADWQAIETAPRDGRQVWVRRIYEGRLIHEGWAVWDTMSADAPMRSWSPGGLDGPLPPDHEYADRKAWSTPDRRYHVPGPTHWKERP